MSVYFSNAVVGFRIGDRVVATSQPYFGDEYTEGQRGVIVDIKGGGLVIAKESGGIIKTKKGTPFICCPECWELA